MGAAGCGPSVKGSQKLGRTQMSRRAFEAFCCRVGDVNRLFSLLQDSLRHIHLVYKFFCVCGFFRGTQVAEFYQWFVVGEKGDRFMTHRKQRKRRQLASWL